MMIADASRPCVWHYGVYAFETLRAGTIRAMFYMELYNVDTLFVFGGHSASTRIRTTSRDVPRSGCVFLRHYSFYYFLLARQIILSSSGLPFIVLFFFVLFFNGKRQFINNLKKAMENLT